MTQQAMHYTVAAIAASLGFSQEIAGGGSLILSRYWKGGAWVWATCIDGGGLPDPDNWLVCAYPPAWDGEDLPDCQVWCSDREGWQHGFQRAMCEAAEMAESLLPSTEALTDELTEWHRSGAFPAAALEAIPDAPNRCAQELWHEMLEQPDTAENRAAIAWLADFCARWDEIQAIEDYRDAIARRGER